MSTRKVRKGYLIDINPFNRGLVRHVLVDEHSVFIPTDAWHSRSFIEANYKLVLFPGEIDYHDWWDGWWTTNWRLADWSWCYGVPRVPGFHACRTERYDDGTCVVYAA